MTKHLRPALLLAALLLPAAPACSVKSCDEGPPPAPPLPAFSVDPSIELRETEVEALETGGARPVAALVDEEGTQTEFVENEIILVTGDDDEVDAFVQRWGGQRLESFDPSDHGLPDLPPMHVVRIDTALAGTESLVDDLIALEPNATGTFRVSSRAGLGLLAAAAREAASGQTVALSWLFVPDAITDRQSMEAPTGEITGYGQNAFGWPFFRTGGVQHIGVAEAWRVLMLTDRIGDGVDIAVIDRGFFPNDDWPGSYEAFSIVPGKDPINERGGDELPFHGTQVVASVAAAADNQFGAAGSAAPVARLTVIYSRTDFISAAIAVVLAWAEGADIISMSFRTVVPTAVAWTVLPFEDITEDVRDSNTLIFGSAGNQGIDVDAEYTSPGGVSWGEKEWHTPCENNGVICVGGIAEDSREKDDGSNYGHENVDIFAPYMVYAAPSDPADGRNIAVKIYGTSFATPFTAGVAALIWSADPSLSADDVARILSETAHASPDDRVKRYVNALGAVQSIVGTMDPQVEIVHPADGAALPGGTPITFQAEAWDLEDIYPIVVWRSDIDGTFGFDKAWTEEDLSYGTHTITALAYDTEMNEAQARITLTVENSDPIVKILQPAESSTFCAGETVVFRGRSTDFNVYPTFALPEESVQWVSAALGVLGTGHLLSRGFDAGGQTITFRGTDDQGRSDEDTIQLTIDPCIDSPPVVEITEPPADIPRGDPDYAYDGYDAAAGKQYKDVTLEGTALDPEDGALSGAALVWATDRTDLQDAGLGTGSPLTVRLYGADETETHVITLTATDGGGHPRTATRSITLWGVL